MIPNKKSPERHYYYYPHYVRIFCTKVDDVAKWVQKKKKKIAVVGPLSHLSMFLLLEYDCGLQGAEKESKYNIVYV